jgi:hypothetical protein
MTDTSAEQRRMEATAHSASEKLRAFHESLTPEEQEVVGLALQQIAAGATEGTDDTAGHLPLVQPPLVGVAAVQQLAVAEVVRTVLGVFGLESGPRRL